MPKSLIIVESPAKIKTLKNILGPNYDIRASMGHVRDLPKSKLSIDVEHNFEPTYITIPDKAKVIKELKEAAGKADAVYLASDPDREGEAIAWHLQQALHLSNPRRIQFNEITRSAVAEALQHPRTVNVSRVDAQQARRVLDRLVGYMLSPVLWKKIKRNLSAGRVQSVALRLICDRQREIDAFVPLEYWVVSATVTPLSPEKPFETKLVSPLNYTGKFGIANEQEAKVVLSEIEGSDWSVGAVKKKDKPVNPSAPFITSTLQQDASRRWAMTNKRTMMIAQQLYEGQEIGKEGSVGLITYMRTDSTRVAAEAQQEARAFVESTYGSQYVPKSPRIYKSRNTAQDAHEAIRPTSVHRRPSDVKPYLNADQYRLYELIWKRFVASQMESGIDEVTTVDVHAKKNGGGYLFRSQGVVRKFDGFRVLYTEAKDDDAKSEEDDRQGLPSLSENEPLRLLDIQSNRKFTEPPPAYSPATLVKALEENGVGRPSTYATIVSTLQDRMYVEIVERKFRPTDLGLAVNDLLVKHFPEIVDVRFTAGMEADLDHVEEGRAQWPELVRRFYGPFEASVAKAETEAERVKLQPRVLEGEPCPECGKVLYIRQGRFGDFVGCSGFPDCTYTRNLSVRIGMECPRPGCDGQLEERKGKSKAGKDFKFYGCSNYPACDFTTFFKPMPDRTCETCGYPIGQNRLGRRVLGYRCTNRACPTAQEEEAKAMAARETATAKRAATKKGSAK